jgi:HAMP domain-containing protein
MILHPSAGAIGKDIHKSQMKEVAALTDLVVAKGFASGYYRWTESDGRVVNKFMALKVVPGRNIHIGSTTYMDEFSRPAKAITMATHTMENKLAHQYNQRFVLFGIVVALVLTVLLAFVYFFSLSVVKPIRELSDIADRISMGDLKAVVNVKGKGEVQVLAQSVERMQTSVKAAIERLQKRREAAAGSSSGEARQR